MPPARPHPTRARGPDDGRFLPGFLAILAMVFIGQKILEVWFGSNAALEYAALSMSRLRAGYVWTPLSYALLHGGLFHLLCNLIGLFFLGRHLEESVGSARLVALTLVGALGAGLAWLGANRPHPGYLIGASGIGMAYLAAFVAQDPRRPFDLPFIRRTLPAWGLLAGFAALDVVGLALGEKHRPGALFGVAHSAHLGGVAAGWLCHWLFLAPRSLLHALRPEVEPPAWTRRSARRPAPAYRVNLDPPRPTPNESPTRPPADATSRAAVRAEVDRLLDRVGERGYDALTPAERLFLAEAGRRLNPR